MSDTKELQENMGIVFDRRIVIAKLIDGSSIIGMVHDDEDGIEGLYIANPSLFLMNPMTYEYDFTEWLVGALDDVHFISDEKIVIWYEVNEEIADDFLEYLSEIHEGDHEEVLTPDDPSSDNVIDFLKSKSTIH